MAVQLQRACMHMQHLPGHAHLRLSPLRPANSPADRYVCCRRSAAPLSVPLQSVPGVCSSSTGVNPDIVTLEANSSTVHWGYYYAGAKPQLVINSGDTVNVEMVGLQCNYM